MLNSIFFIFAIIVGIASAAITWKVYHHFWSLAESVYESNFSYFVKKFSISAVIGVFAFLAVFTLFAGKEENEVAMDGVEPQHAIQEKNTKENQLSQDNIDQSIPSEQTNQNDRLGLRNKESDENNSTQLISDPKDSNSEKTEDPESISKKSEACLNYKGDDPIVIQRLGCQ